MSKSFFLKFISLFFILQSFSFYAQEKAKDRAIPEEGLKEEAVEFAAPEMTPKTEEFHSPDGSYRKEVNGKVIIKGFYKDKLKHGEFSYFIGNGILEKQENYTDGILDGYSTFYSEGRRTGLKQYSKGKKINYEYEFEKQDTSLVAGPYTLTDLKEGRFIIRRKMKDYNDYSLMHFFYDTIFFKSSKPIIINHHELIKEGKDVKKHIHGSAELYDKSLPAYSPELISSLAEQCKYFTSQFSVYPPKANKVRVKYFDEKGNLTMYSDSGYVIFYRETRKDSITESRIGKVAQGTFDLAEQLVFEVRYDTAASDYYTNLYYGKNKKLLYQVGSRGSVPDYVKIYDDSVRKASSGNVLIDYFGTAYVFNSANKIDTSFSRLEYKLRVKQKIKNGRYFYLPSEPMYGKQYRMIEITDNKKNEYSVDSLLKSKADKGPAFLMYQNDSVFYLLKQTANRGEAFLSYKYIYRAGRLYYVHNRLKTRDLWYREEFLYKVEQDTIPVLKSELLSEADFKNALQLRSISKLDKPTFLRWAQSCTDLNELRLHVSASVKPGYNQFYETNYLYCLYTNELYKMGYNPYFTRSELESLKIKLNLSEEEIRKFKFLFR